MTIGKFYEEFKSILIDRVSIVNNCDELYNDYFENSKPQEYLMNYEIKNIYMGYDVLIIQIK